MSRITITNLARLLLVAALPALLSIAFSAPVGAQTLGWECSNDEFDYTIGVPTGWYANEHVEGGELDDVSGCRFFSPEDFSVQPQSGLADVAIGITPQRTEPEGGTATTVGGRPAVVTETQTVEDGMEPAGTRHYDYWIELGEGLWLVAGTSDAPNFVGDYEQNRETLDAMMDSLTFDERGVQLPDTALPAAR